MRKSMQMHSENIDQIATALAKCQGEIEGATKDSANPYFKSKYADFYQVRQAAREPMAKYGLSFVQPLLEVDGKTYLVTLLMHASGQWIRSQMPLPNTKGDAQSIGSAITYFRRYCFSSLMGISTYDDDGEGATKPAREEAKVQEKEAAIAAAPTLTTLLEALPTVGCFENEATVKNYLKSSAVKRKSTEEEVITSAMMSTGQLEKFAAALEKSLKS
jgi:hypothetical protein